MVKKMKKVSPLQLFLKDKLEGGWFINSHRMRLNLLYLHPCWFYEFCKKWIFTLHSVSNPINFKNFANFFTRQLWPTYLCKCLMHIVTIFNYESDAIHRSYPLGDSYLKYSGFHSTSWREQQQVLLLLLSE